jgi:hypothetical protein
VGADVDEQMSALGEGLVALAVGARVFLWLGWHNTVELGWVRGGCRGRLNGKHERVNLGLANVALELSSRL